MRRPFGPESHETGSTISDLTDPFRAREDRTNVTLADLILPALSVVYRTPWVWIDEVAETYNVTDEDVERTYQTVEADDSPPADWRTRGWCPGLHGGVL